ncbi:glycosyltransferase [Halomicrobium mukohataei]|uniref:Glycosyltransferase n=1 Tax=Halomicrobium mukohataei TaxID=57705 RepID=A0A847UA74_9EURY|nr:glycosyltransferase family 4 protein [Halomicrobium mukohataei]NLV08380.1 glycosyltransferase [Halomicrobium mukohataei]
MDLLVLTRVYPPYGSGGLAHHLMYLYEEIASRGHEVTILAGKSKGFRSDTEINRSGHRNITVQRVEFGYREGYYVLYPLALRWYLRNFDTSRYDAVLTHTQIPFEFDDPVIAKNHDCSRQSRQFVREGMAAWMKFGESALNLMRPFVDRGAIRAANHLIYNSKLTMDGWNDLYDIRTPESVVHNGVDVSIFYPRESEREGGYILFVSGSSDGSKDKLRQSGILDFARESSYDVCVAGRKSVDSPHVTALGRFSHEELAEVYSAAAVTIHPSQYEPFGNVVTESLACGTPVVTNDTVGASEILDQSCGVITDDLHEGVETAMKMRSEDCISTAQEHTWGSVAEETLSIVKKCVEA